MSRESQALATEIGVLDGLYLPSVRNTTLSAKQWANLQALHVKETLKNGTSERPSASIHQVILQLRSNYLPPRWISMPLVILWF